MLAHLKKTTLAVVARRLDPLLHLTAATGLRLCRTPEDEGTGGNGEVGLLVRLGPLEFVRDVRFCAPQAHARADEIAMEYSVRAAKQQQIHRLEARVAELETHLALAHQQNADLLSKLREKAGRA